VTKDVVCNEPVLIVLGDEIFEEKYKEMLDACGSDKEYAGSIGVKEVDNPSLYGIIELNKDGSIQRLIEKPKSPKSNLAVAGVYVINDTKILFESLDEVVKNTGGHGGEYQLTDALQIMADKGAKLKTFKIENWYDCGRPEMLLDVNRILLKNSGRINGVTENCVIINPVIIEEECIIKDSVIGPYVSIANGSKIDNSIIKNSIIGMKSEISGVLLKDSIVSAEAKVVGKEHRLYVGENAEIDMR
jgi:glucose-1-phosphate thymidylyltransferase